MRAGAALLGAAACAVVATAAHAHSFAPMLLHVRELAPGTFDVRWQRLGPQGERALPGADLVPVLPGRCRVLASAQASDPRAAIRWRMECGRQGLAGAAFRVRGIEASPVDVIVRIERLGAAPLTGILHGAAAEFVVPARGRTAARAGTAYFVLGVEHIARGIDHLLFLACLMVLVPGMGALARTVTAFTAAHSLTLALAALGQVRFDQAAVDTAVAASIVLLAAEIARGDGKERASLTRRKPWMAAFAFGLLHGLGFAGALQEFGLPSGQVPLALLSFNVGVEAGQLAFVALLWPVLRASERLPAGARRLAVQVPVYAAGAAAFAWSAVRFGALLGGA